jgi:outer membrane protein assembly factor BamA
MYQVQETELNSGIKRTPGQIVSVRIYGGQHMPAAEKDKLVGLLLNHPFYFDDASDGESQAYEYVVWFWRDHGFVDAFVQPTLKIAGPASGAVPYDLIVFVREGRQYKLRGVSIEPATPGQSLAFATESLQRLYPTKPGDIFSVSGVWAWLEGLRRVYIDNGYIDFTAEPRLEEETQSGEINITMILDQGKQFRISSFTVETLNPKLKEALSKGVRVGDVFSNAAWNQLLEANKGLFPSNFSPSDVEMRRNVKAGTVEINVSALPCP